MTATTYLSVSVENARIAAAEERMAPRPEKPRLFDLSPLYRQFEAVTNSPTVLREITHQNDAVLEGFAYLLTVRLVGSSQVCRRYRITAAPWASWDDVADELDTLTIPF